jgi:hypothetical protein
MRTSETDGFQGAILVAQRDVEALFAFSERISLEPITKDTTNCADQDTNSEFTQLTKAAETSLQAALDDVDGPTLTHFDTALDELRLARLHYFRNVAENRANSHFHVDNAHNAFARGISEFMN